MSALRRSAPISTLYLDFSTLNNFNSAFRMARALRRIAIDLANLNNPQKSVTKYPQLKRRLGSRQDTKNSYPAYLDDCVLEYLLNIKSAGAALQTADLEFEP